jgi:LemA protein
MSSPEERRMSDLWKCPNCGTILQKKDQNLEAQISRGAVVAGIVTCGNCGAEFGAADVYGGKYDPVTTRSRSIPLGRWARSALGGLGCIVVITVMISVGSAALNAYNQLVSLGQDVDARWSQVESQYRQRARNISELVSTIQDTTDFEKSILEEVKKAQKNVGDIDVSRLPDDKDNFARFQRAQDALAFALSRLIKAAELHPWLRTSPEFRDRQLILEGEEVRIASDRILYNNSVRAYNVRRKRFPMILVASLLGMKEKASFKYVGCLWRRGVRGSG